MTKYILCRNCLKLHLLTIEEGDLIELTSPNYCDYWEKHQKLLDLTLIQRYYKGSKKDD